MPEEKKARTLTQDILDFLSLEADNDKARLDVLLALHGVDEVRAWTHENTKHQHSLLHYLASKARPEAIQHLVVVHHFSLDLCRPSDQCTPLHLAAWTKQPKLIALLLHLGADPTIKNKYGENCQELVALKDKIENIVWLDLELTCLPLDGVPAILECAVVITDKHLNELAHGEWAVHYPSEQLEALSTWHQQHFKAVADGGNGLFAAVEASTVDKPQFEEELLALLKEHCPAGCCPLAGQSVHCDREVLLTAMPAVYKHVSHQVIDVSTINSLLSRWSPALLATEPPAVGYNHRAMGDIRASIARLQWHREHVFKVE